MYVLLISLPVTAGAQDVAGFETRMNEYTVNYVSQNHNRYDKEKTAMSEEHETISPEDFDLYLAEEAKDKFVKENMKEYLNIYYPPSAMVAGVDSFVCDNGGFEEGFKYYRGYISNYSIGSSNCRPYYFGNPLQWLSVGIPFYKHFEIVNPGLDPLVGIEMVKFGNKAAKINNQYGHVSNCKGDHGIDKLTKRFKVTRENRDFTIWYSVVLENPSNQPHINQQPYFNIKCDLAPANELCFDAKILRCDEYFPHHCPFDSLDVLKWSCHRFKIPKEDIGKIATLEIVAADCGAGDHFGYAYIDGICEECDSSALGSIKLNQSINYISCDGDLAKVCGSYTLPAICGNHWTPVTISVPGYDIYNLEIDTTNHTFCFDFSIFEFKYNENCIEIYAEILFADGIFQLPIQLSNSIEICKNLYIKKYNYYVELPLECEDNATPENLSDDYYFLNLHINVPDQTNWVISRQLLEPYQNESGLYLLASGTGYNDLVLGPFRVQEGDWTLKLDFGDCQYEELIIDPGFCKVTCDNDFKGIEITNVKCDPNNAGFWTFDLFVPGSGQFWLGNSLVNKGHHVIPSSNFDECYPFIIYKDNNGFKDLNCKFLLSICPPKPCNVPGGCDLEVYPVFFKCSQIPPYTYEFEVEVKWSQVPGLYLCYKADKRDPFGLWVNVASGSYDPFIGIQGSFNSDIRLTMYYSQDPNCSTSNECQKVLMIPMPDCNDRRFHLIRYRTDVAKVIDELKVIPNPIQSDELTLISSMPKTEFRLYDISGRLIYADSFNGMEYRHNISLKAGIYVISYIQSDGSLAQVKFVKN